MGGTGEREEKEKAGGGERAQKENGTGGTRGEGKEEKVGRGGKSEEGGEETRNDEDKLLHGRHTFETIATLNLSAKVNLSVFNIILIFTYFS